MDRRELQDKAFTCLPGCGFCCTFQPEVSRVEFRGLAKALPFVPLVEGGGRTYLALQGGGAGACSLLKDRQCSAYEVRPSHCRYFPFHVYFGERVEVYVDLTCRGVTDAPGQTLDRAFAESGAEAAALARGDEAAAGRRAHRDFRARAEAEEAWRDPTPELARLVARAEALATGAELERLAEAAGEPADADALAEAALEVFEAPLGTRPFWLDPDLRWLTCERDGDALRVVEMREDGGVEERARVEDLARHAEVPGVAEALAPYVRLLYGRGVFRGASFARVDDHAYGFDVEAGMRACAAEVGADLVLRSRVVAAVLPGLAPAEVAREVVRFYDADFLDASTVGGYL